MEARFGRRRFSFQFIFSLLLFSLVPLQTFGLGEYGGIVFRMGGWYLGGGLLFFPFSFSLLRIRMLEMIAYDELKRRDASPGLFSLEQEALRIRGIFLYIPNKSHEGLSQWKLFELSKEIPDISKTIFPEGFCPDRA